MPFIAKSAPASPDADDIMTIRERGMYGGDAISAGDTIFLWSSETRGGNGLWARATVLRRLPESGRIAIVARVDRVRPEARLMVEHLEPYRDSRGANPMIGLSRKLYGHAHNKIAALDDDEAAFLDSYFGA
ncbi:hypothetical protein ACG873_24810 [Mesorhizobium sp. AaZ16]|uniref:hypothetical protein n=1 Tax=Mesorhizobium sp. AaZ16 TaxID=3402289 RepID=UPI00374F456D